MGKKIDMTGWKMKEHGVPESKLTVIKENINYSKEHNLTKKYVYWDCLCECGKITTVKGLSLRNGKTLSCGCLNSKDILGQTFGKLTVIEKTEKRAGSNIIWKCKCSCGNICEVASHNLIRQATQSCGCLLKEKNRENKIIDISNQRSGKLIALNPTDERSGSSVIWLCKCDCGNFVKVNQHDFQRQSVQSCGCLKSKGEMKISQILQENNIPFEKQKTFENCISNKGKKLRFDFYINNSFLLEFDGIQHFEYNSKGWNTNEKFNQTKERDNIKNKYCLEHNIPLKRIPYWALEEITLEDIMGNKFSIMR